MRVGLQSVIDPNLWMCFYIEGSSDMEIPLLTSCYSLTVLRRDLLCRSIQKVKITHKPIIEVQPTETHRSGFWIVECLPYHLFANPLEAHALLKGAIRNFITPNFQTRPDKPLRKLLFLWPALASSWLVIPIIFAVKARHSKFFLAPNPNQDSKLPQTRTAAMLSTGAIIWISLRPLIRL